MVHGPNAHYKGSIHVFSVGVNFTFLECISTGYGLDD
jgi:hypothetical protein